MLVRSPGKVAHQTITVARSYPQSSFARVAHSTRGLYRHPPLGTTVSEFRPKMLLESVAPSAKPVHPVLVPTYLVKTQANSGGDCRKVLLISHQFEGRMAVEIVVCVPCLPYSMFGWKYWDPLPQHASCVFFSPHLGCLSPPQVAVSFPSCVATTTPS